MKTKQEIEKDCYRYVKDCYRYTIENYNNGYTEENYKKEIIDFIKSIYEEIEYSKKHLTYKSDGTEKNYNKDIDKFRSAIDFYEESFIGENINIREPQKVNEIFSISASLLYYQFSISEKAIFELFKKINKDVFNLKCKKPSIKQAQDRQHDLMQKWEISLNDTIKREIQIIQNKENLTNDGVKEHLKKYPHISSILNKE